MSLNLMLIFVDKKGRWVNRVDLLQTPTEVTKLCLKTKEGKEHSAFECRDLYLSWVEETFLDMDFECRALYFSWVEETFLDMDFDIKQQQQELINGAMNEWGNDYEPKFIEI